MWLPNFGAIEVYLQSRRFGIKEQSVVSANEPESRTQGGERESPGDGANGRSKTQAEEGAQCLVKTR